MNAIRRVLAVDLEARRAELGWTMAQLAARAGVSESSAHRCLRGCNARIRTVIAVADALGFEVSFARRPAA